MSQTKVAGADLVLSKTGDPETITVGQQVAFVLAVRNAGPASASGTTVTDTLPDSVAVASYGPSRVCSIADRTVTCLLGSLPSGERKTVRIALTPRAAGRITNRATVETSTFDTNSSNDSATAVTTVTAAADLSVDKRDEPDPVEAGKRLTYTLRVTNAGLSAAAEVMVIDTLAPRATFESAEPSQSCSTADRTVTCLVGSVPSGQSKTVTITVKPGTAGTIVNSARVTSATFDPDRTNNSVTAKTEVVPRVVPSVSIGDAEVDEGEPVVFQITLSAPAPEQVRIGYRTVDGSATTAGGDYEGTEQAELVFEPGQTEQTIAITVTDDARHEPDESFRVRLLRAAGAAISFADREGRATIHDNDPSPPVPSVSIGDAEVDEGEPVVFQITLSAPAPEQVRIGYRTVDGSATTAGGDYEGTEQAELVFEPGQTEQTIAITVTDDARHEPDESFRVRLLRAAGAAISFADREGRATIHDNDPSPPPGGGLMPWWGWLLGAVGAAVVTGGASLALGRFLIPGPPGRLLTGFASGSDPGRSISQASALACGQPYYVWVEIKGGKAATPPGYAPEGVHDAQLTVALFAPEDGIRIEEGTDTGDLRLRADGSAVIQRQPAAPQGSRPPAELAARRLYFPFKAPAEPGAVELRCNLYHRNLLVQSQLVTAKVKRRARKTWRAQRTVSDYIVAPTLGLPHLAALEMHRLSILLNESQGGTHDFYFYAEGHPELTEPIKNRARLDDSALTDLIGQARRELGKATWGDAEPYVSAKAYRYEAADGGHLRRDLIALARCGYALYDAIVSALAGGYEESRRLADLMRTPGLVQIASVESARRVVPAALFYDYPLVTGSTPGRDDTDDYQVCAEFLAALEREPPLEELRCFQGDCPSWGEEMTVCPSGFWGYRHALGLPVTVGRGPDLPAAVERQQQPQLIVTVSTDPELIGRRTHEEVMRKLFTGFGWNYADSRSQTFQLLKGTKAEVVYFYCHGGVEDGRPWIQVGPLDERRIMRGDFRLERVVWELPRPLVVINGCRTTALTPEKAIEFVSALVENARASGVIGSEITVFEQLAATFAEEFFRRFLLGAPVGPAVRGARLSLLKAGNPLGLVYIPFALASLRLNGSTAA